MRSREEELRQSLKATDNEKALQAAIDLCREFLFVNKNFGEAETVLLEAVGRQSSHDGHIAQLLLGELYIHIGELPRAERFLNIAAASSKEDVKKKADELQATISNR
jgi:Tfp pilus assembly protein FimV